MTAGLFKMDPQLLEQQIPPHWNCYIATDDVDATSARAEELGATIIMAPMDVEQVGRFGTIIDPQGAAFMVLQFFHQD